MRYFKPLLGSQSIYPHVSSLLCLGLQLLFAWHLRTMLHLLYSNRLGLRLVLM